MLAQLTLPGAVKEFEIRFFDAFGMSRASLVYNGSLAEAALDATIAEVMPLSPQSGFEDTLILTPVHQSVMKLCYTLSRQADPQLQNAT